MKTRAPEDIDGYIEAFPPNVQKILQKIRNTIQKAAPDAEEAISYAIPTFRLNGNLIHFAAFQNHIGLYPAPRGVEEFKKELAQYEGGKGTIKFPLDQSVPFDLITRIVKYRVKERIERDKARMKKQVSSAKKR